MTPLPLLALLLAAVVVTAGRPAAAQGFDLARRADVPIEVYADDGIEWSQDGKSITARGNAKAVRGTMTVTADTLTAFYRERNGDSEIHRLEAAGKVTIASPKEKATGAHAAYDLDKAVVVLTGAPARLVTPTDTVTAQQRIEYWEKDRKAVAFGDAVAVRGDRRIRADRLTAYFVEGRGGELALHRADAAGDVSLRTAREVVTGEKGDYDAESGIVTLTGSVKITRDDNQLNGGYALVNLNTGISSLMAAPPGAKSGGQQRVQGLFVPEKKTQAAPSPGPAR